MDYMRLFIYLQILDFLTTLVALKLGLDEASPFIRMLLRWGPWIAVATSKFIAIGLAGASIALNRQHLVRKINYWYASVVVWNLFNILVA